MGIFDTIGKIATGIVSPAGGILEKAFGSKERNRANEIMNDQIKAYREQSEISKKQLDETRNQQEAEKRRINEKQIRSLRRNYRPAGLLGVGSEGEQSATKLGG